MRSTREGCCDSAGYLAASRGAAGAVLSSSCAFAGWDWTTGLGAFNSAGVIAFHLPVVPAGGFPGAFGPP